MIKLLQTVYIFCSLFLFSFTLTASTFKPVSASISYDLPDKIHVGGQNMHVQGLALDAEKGYMYFSFTSRFIKTDLQGNIIGSIDRIQGHLGAMTFDPISRKVYASLECKDDEIGEGIASKLGVKKMDRANSVFYVAIIDVDKVNKIGIDPENDPMFKTVCIKEACLDYKSKVKLDGQNLSHKYGCSGIDGITIGPNVGCKLEEKSNLKSNYIYIAYGVYGDITRSDNDYQVILQYKLSSLEKYAKPVTFGVMNTDGPKNYRNKFFVFTGNTNYGVQNLAYDAKTNCMFMAVYKGKKEVYPNFTLFAIDMSKPFEKEILEGVTYDSKKHKILHLADAGLQERGIRGWRFKWGSTGLFSFGNGLWYISHNLKDKNTKKHSCDAVLYKWHNDGKHPFLRVNNN